MPPTRRSTRTSSSPAASKAKEQKEEKDVEIGVDTEDPSDEVTYELDGVLYNDYSEYVAAKRKRNHAKLHSLGLTDASTVDFMNKKAKTSSAPASATHRGLQSTRRKSTSEQVAPRRSSRRISGSKTNHISLDYNVKHWDRDMTSVVREDGTTVDVDDDQQPQQERFFNDRINDGSDLTVEDAVNLNEGKWIKDDSVQLAETFIKALTLAATESLTALPSKLETPTPNGRPSRARTQAPSPDSVLSFDEGSKTKTSPVDDLEISKMVEELSIDNEEWVAKVTPERIYSVAAHPGSSKLIAAAGDKQGYIGLWDVDGKISSINGNSGGGGSSGGDDDTKKKSNASVSLFHIHSRPICCLEWLTNETMVTASYDGSVRRLHAERGIFEEIFATYDSDSSYSEDLGFDLDQGRGYWTQSVMPDPRYGLGGETSNPCLFVTTSYGHVFHLDLRVSGREKITFHESLSAKKINTVSLHPNGTTLASGGLDGVVRLFDIRKFGDDRGHSKWKSPKPICTQHTGLSISSSFFSPSGQYLLTTSFANRLDILEDAHMKTGASKPTHSIRHNNQTGRWLTTFQATWHPSLDIFCSGSMNQPRCMEVFDGKGGKLLRAVTGDSLTSVMSRTCFHPTTKELIMIGGNSSGRVVAVRKNL